MENLILIRGRNGWNAETKVDLGITRRDNSDWKLMLTISTEKSLIGKLHAHADVAAEYNGRVMFAICGDYRKIIETSAERCSEKTVRAMHARAIARLPEILAEATAFYATKQSAS